MVRRNAIVLIITIFIDTCAPHIQFMLGWKQNIALSRAEHDALSLSIFMAEMGSAVVLAPCLEEAQHDTISVDLSPDSHAGRAVDG